VVKLSHDSLLLGSRKQYGWLVARTFAVDLFMPSELGLKEEGSWAGGSIDVGFLW
jgi:hypothetical protein